MASPPPLKPGGVKLCCVVSFCIPLLKIYLFYLGVGLWYPTSPLWGGLQVQVLSRSARGLGTLLSQILPTARGSEALSLSLRGLGTSLSQILPTARGSEASIYQSFNMSINQTIINQSNKQMNNLLTYRLINLSIYYQFINYQLIYPTYRLLHVIANIPNLPDVLCRPHLSNLNTDPNKLLLSGDIESNPGPITLSSSH